MFDNDSDKRKVFFEERCFLNEEINMSAYIIAQIELYSYDKELSEKDILTFESVTLEIADCSRKINLDFQIGVEHGVKSIRKLDKLIDILLRFRIALEEANKELIENEVKAEELKKEKETKE